MPETPRPTPEAAHPLVESITGKKKIEASNATPEERAKAREHVRKLNVNQRRELMNKIAEYKTTAELKDHIEKDSHVQPALQELEQEANKTEAPAPTPPYKPGDDVKTEEEVKRDEESQGFFEKIGSFMQKPAVARIMRELSSFYDSTKGGLLKLFGWDDKAIQEKTALASGLYLDYFAKTDIRGVIEKNIKNLGPGFQGKVELKLGKNEDADTKALVEEWKQSQATKKTTLVQFAAEKFDKFLVANKTFLDAQRSPVPVTLKVLVGDTKLTA